MPRTDLNVVAPSIDGTVLALAAANVDGHAFANDGRRYLLVNNTSAAAITITAITPGDVEGLAIADRGIAVAAGVMELVGPFTPSTFNQRSGVDQGKVYLDFSAVAGVTIALLGSI